MGDEADAPPEEEGGDAPPAGDEGGAPPAEAAEEPAEVPAESAPAKDAPRGSTASNFPLVDSAVLQELREADAQAIKTSKLIESMKQDILKFQKKKDMTDEDLKNLKKMHDALGEKLSEFEQIANKIQKLLGMADLTPESIALAISSTPLITKDMPSKPEDKPARRGECPGYGEGIHLTSSEEKKLTELQNKLPQVVICGTGKEHDIPKIIICEPAKPLEDEESVKDLTQKLSSSIKMQEKLAHEAAEMEGSRYQLQEALLCKDRKLEALQKQVECLRSEMKLISKENCDLQKKLLETCQPPHPPMCKRELYLKFAGALPEWDTGGMPNRDIESQIEQMENVVCSMKEDINSVQNERKMLQTQTQLLQCAFSHQPTCLKEKALQHQEGVDKNPCVKELQAQLRDLKSQYCQLDADYNDKISEIACLRTELKEEQMEIEQLTERCCYAEARADDLIERLKMVEIEKQNIMVNREQFIDMEQHLALAKQHMCQCQEEVENLQCLVHEQNEQIADYKEKYLTAQQTVEEQKRIIEKLHVQSVEIKERLMQEVQQFKIQIQQKLGEFAPLPEKLRTNETKLQVAQQNIEDLTKELLDAKSTIDNLLNNPDKEALMNENLQLQSEIESLKNNLQDLKNENTNFKATIARFEELTQHNEWLYEEKVSEVQQLTTQLATLREESARQIAKMKERSEAVKKLMQSQISTLEKQLAESRAAAAAAAKERDEIRAKMQHQIMSLNDNFGQAQIRIRNLQDHINYLKSSGEIY